MNEPLLASTFLFRFSIPCRHYPGKWTTQGFDFGPAFVVPSFHGELNEAPMFADFRLGWNNDGIFFSVRVQGKKQSVWCRETRIEDSDGLVLWLDTRNQKNVHRASRFCHQFAFMPLGGGRQYGEPTAKMLPINRAREEPKAVPAKLLQVRSEKRVDGYLLEGHIPSQAITGYDPEEHSKLGFTYAIIDREFGWQTFHLGSEFPFASDPSLWGMLELQHD